MCSYRFLLKLKGDGRQPQPADHAFRTHRGFRSPCKRSQIDVQASKCRFWAADPSGRLKALRMCHIAHVVHIVGDGRGTLK